MTRLIASACLLLGLMAPVAATAQSGAGNGRPPALVVTIVVDQFSANLFNQYRSRFTGGLRTLADQGLVYANGYQAQGITKTCPGHATVLSGAWPTTVGIPSNEWIDPVSGLQVYCLAAPQNTLADGGPGENGRVGPDNIRVTMLPDWLKSVSPQSRIYAVSGKDRGAINLAGHNPDGAYWIQEGFGLTTYVEPGQTAGDRLAPVAAFNAAYRARYSADPVGSWTYQHEFCRTLKGESSLYGEVLHADLPPDHYNLEDSPALDETTLAAATDLLERQQLGRRGVTDMLGISLSGTDKIGHAYGTQGPEMCEQLLRMDEALGAFLDKVAEVPGGAIVVLTADHGGSDSPERMAERGAPAGRNDPEMMDRINASLQVEFGLMSAPLQNGSTGLIVAGADHVRLSQPLRGQIVAASLALLAQEPTVAYAVAIDDLLADPLPARDIEPEALSVRERLRLSAVADKGADIMIAYGPYLTGQTRPGGAVASHGSVWDYDRRVPIIFWRPDGPAQERFWQIRTVDIAPSLANLMGLTPADTVDGLCLDLGVYGAPACPAVEPAR
ncbi:alkaline phosphatase family protein [Brevundimonas sp. AJA228-03]|uniref:alkaline phosphatase family protein n=1 Tax=Brevundimonas sp. AJA228-03 TaxID=2752515 RepID=UPI001AE054FA|nr:alkaline phosphatase family protein [Brevundimonas sp. AJA228-03]QTN20358.1 alkaline phosphatase family protein [Brevundimonas sp. AJA228-03]